MLVIILNGSCTGVCVVANFNWQCCWLSERCCKLLSLTVKGLTGKSINRVQWKNGTSDDLALESKFLQMFSNLAYRLVIMSETQ